MREHSRKEIWKMFDTITYKYDFLNHFLSLGLDFTWRRKLSSQIKYFKNIKILDLCCGTCDQTLSIIKNKNFDGNIAGMDMSKNMLSISREKLIKKRVDKLVSLLRGNAQSIPLKENSVDTVTMTFGIRNICNISKCLKDIHRVLKPSGQVLILEFSIPDNRLIRYLYLFFITYPLPLFGGLISKNRKAYIYLSDTIRTFPSGNDFLKYLSNAGFGKTKLNRMCFGTVTLYSGEK
jgi:demethylmenaquinone methyltransferase / 2-methoxy-6-polyprenyl-1,4-benzoquinol methylase